MADKFPLSKAPNGLLGALDLKSPLGRNPQDFSELLSPSLETLEFYLLPNRIAISLAGPWAAVNTPIIFAGATGIALPYQAATGVFTVPQKEVVRLKQLCVYNQRAAADAGLTLEIMVCVRRINSAALVAIGSAVFGPRPATDLVGLQPVPLTQPLWLGPGDSLVLVPNTTQTAAGSAISMQLDFDTMPAG